MAKTDTTVVCDAGPVIHLDEMECLFLLKDFSRVILPAGVRDEVLAHRNTQFESTDISWSVVPGPFTTDKHVLTMCKMFSLDRGETEAISVIGNHPDAILLTDDAAARLAASKLGFRVHGTIGVLLRAIRRKLLRAEDVIDILIALPVSSTLHIKQSLLDEVISQVKKEAGCHT